jgi:hypothetical protein
MLLVGIKTTLKAIIRAGKREYRGLGAGTVEKE